MKILSPPERIIKLLDYTKLTYPKFAKEVGRNNPQYLRDIVKGLTLKISDKVADEILKRYPEINEKWIKFGEGEMLNNNLSSVKDSRVNYSKNVLQVDNSNYMEVEYRDLSVSAGALTSTISKHDKRTILVPREYDNGDYLVVRVAGPSMDDGTKYSIPEGAEILIKRYHLQNGESLPIRGNLFVVDFKDGQDLKQIIEHNIDEGYVVCHSYNKDFSDYKVQMEDVIAFYIYRKIIGFRPPVRDLK